MDDSGVLPIVKSSYEKKGKITHDERQGIGQNQRRIGRRKACFDDEVIADGVSNPFSKG